MKHFTSLIAGMTLLLSAFPMLAQDEEPIFDLTEREVFNSCTQFSLDYDHDSYDVWNFNNFNSNPYMYNYNLTEPYYSDYLLTPAIPLESGCLYRIETSPAAYNSGKTGNLTIGLGQDDNVEAFTVLAKYENIPYGNINTAEARILTFSVPVNGNYKIYFHGKGNALSLYKTKIFKEGASSIPMSVSELQVLPAADGSAEATVMFTMPSTTVSGQAIDGQLKYSIFRNDDETPVKNGRANAGEFVSYVDSSVEIGMVTYSVVVISGEETSTPVSASTYVGPETPEAVTALTITKNDNTFLLSWNAPLKGVHGAVLNPALISYNVTRIVDGEATLIAENIADSSYTDTFISENLCVISYSVTAVFNGEESEAVNTKSFTLGSVSLPFADSFAGGSFEAGGWTAEIVKGNFNWQAVSTNPYTNQSPKVTEAYDGDGGFAFFNSWSAQVGNDARLITPPLKYTSPSDTPVVEFYLCHSADNRNDGVKIQVSCDNGEWVTVEDAFAPVKGNNLEWEKYTFILSDGLNPDASTFRVALLTDNQYGHNIVIDKVRVYNMKIRDLGVNIISAPEKVMAGNNIDITYTIVNNGATAVDADNYTVDIFSDFPGEIELPANQPIAPLDAVTYSISVPLTAAEARIALDDENMQSFNFNFKVYVAADEDLANDVANAYVTPIFSSKESPSNPNIERLDDGSMSMSWTHAGDPTYEPVNATTSFEEYDAKFTGPFNGFVSIDLDGKDGGTYYTASGSAFNVVTAETGATPTGRDGKQCIGLSLAANAQQNDWLISPELNCPAESSMDLSFLIATRGFSSSAYTYSFEVVYSTEDYDSENPAETFTHVIAKKTSGTYGDFKPSETFSKMTFSDIPAEAKYVALHFTSKISLASALWIDNISITENILQPLLGYHVYEHNVARLNETLIPATENTFLIPVAEEAAQAREAAAGRQFYVTAVYPEGESAPTELTQIPTGVAVIEAASGEAVYYNLQGVRVAEPAQGIYIRVRNGKTDKVIVR